MFVSIKFIASTGMNVDPDQKHSLVATHDISQGGQYHNISYKELRRIPN